MFDGHFIAGLRTITAPCLAQDATAPKKDDKAASPNDAQMMSTMMEIGLKPGENHKMLEGLVGSWSYKVKNGGCAPDAPPLQWNPQE